jgi:excisionase family DNA binding protein
MVQLLTLIEVAQELQRSVSVVHRLIALSQLRVYRLGQKIRVSRADLDLYLRWRARNPQKAQPWYTRGADRLDPRPVSIRGRPFWQVELGDSGVRRRVRRTFANHEEAQAFAEQKKIERSRFGGQIGC